MALRIIADENMPNVEAWFSDSASRIVRKPGRSLTTQDLQDANVLLVRSVTKVNQQLINGSGIGFVGSATIGTDHIDQPYLASQKIPFHYAPGCNAQSVVDWLLSVFARLHIDHQLEWWHKTIAIVGVGHVGGSVAARLEKLGCKVLLCDPPKHEAGLLANHQPLADVMAQADIVCFHTPHTTEGIHATERMVGDIQLAGVKLGSWIINAGRGPVFQHDPLLAAAQQGNINLVLDVWPNEPVVGEALLSVCQLASPHVAGYSLEGKHKGTQMLAEAVFEWAAIKDIPQVIPPAAPTIDARLYQQEDQFQWASELVLAVYDPARDTAAMAASVENQQIDASVFDALRKHYPTRRELHSVVIEHAPPALADWLCKLGFRCT